MKILVTGGAGFIGSNLVEELVRRDHEVVAFDNFYLGTRTNLEGLDVEVVSGDIRDADSVNKAASGVDIVFNQAAASSSPMFAKDLRGAVAANIDGFINILNAAKDNGAKKIIYASTSSIYGNLRPPLREDMNVTPPNFYAVTKLANEHLAKVYTSECGIETVGFRYMSVYGPKEEGKAFLRTL